mmetsp:Transcript_42087/g.61873  ORF Transcript_42087/g.61873 Transcript_42087/m.61873 type:complete len:208 (+) Transcript_42087:151-774(+)
MRMHCHKIKKKGRVRMYAHPVSNYTFAARALATLQRVCIFLQATRKNYNKASRCCVYRCLTHANITTSPNHCDAAGWVKKFEHAPLSPKPPHSHQSLLSSEPTFALRLLVSGHLAISINARSSFLHIVSISIRVRTRYTAGEASSLHVANRESALFARGSPQTVTSEPTSLICGKPALHVVELRFSKSKGRRVTVSELVTAHALVGV